MKSTIEVNIWVIIAILVVLVLVISYFELFPIVRDCSKFMWLKARGVGDVHIPGDSEGFDTRDSDIVNAGASIGATGGSAGSACSSQSAERRTRFDKAADDEIANSADVDRAEVLNEGFTDDGLQKALREDGGGYDGQSYSDYIMNKSIDSSIIDHHAEYVKGRMADPLAYSLGRASMPVDRHDTYDPVPWVGLRRPSGVPMGNPMQVADIDYDRLNSGAKFTWTTGNK